MRNLKRVLSLVLAAMMLLGMMVIGASAASTTEGGYTSNLGDYDAINQDYQEAASVIEGLHVIQGYEDGDFHPTDILQRDQAAKIIAYMLLGEEKAEALNPNTTHFTDIPAGYWAAGYIDYCVTKGILAGYGDGTFGPHDKLTGYQFGKMLLVALGYDAEIEGYANDDNYITNISVDMIENDIYVEDVLIVDPVSREVAAQMAFNTLGAIEVDYTYQHFVQVATPVPGDITLGQDVYGLDYNIKAYDDWGRPAAFWTANKKAAPAPTVATYIFPLATEEPYTETVDECDIYADAGLTGTPAIKAAYIDGESIDVDNAAVTSNRIPTINALATTSKVGAQGRVTEVYVVDKQVWIVEINTYLAQVTKVNAQTEDKRGHTTPASVDMNVYMYEGTSATDKAVTRNLNYVTDDPYSVGDFALVQVLTPNDNPTVKTVSATQPAAYGELEDWTNTTSKVGDKTYNDADKLVRIDDITPNGYYEKNAAFGADRAVFTDAYGNLIGLVKTDLNYLLIEKIQWRQGEGFDNDYALANVMLADGTKLPNVKISQYFDGISYKAVTNGGDSYGHRDDGTVSDSYVNNGDDMSTGSPVDSGWYGHLFTWTRLDDGTYRVDEVGTDAPTATTSATGASTDPWDGEDEHIYGQIINGSQLIGDQAPTNKNDGSTSHTADEGDQFIAGDNTVFFVYDEAAYTYKRYEGIDNVPTMRKVTKMCVVETDDLYARYVVVTCDVEEITDLYYISSNPTKGLRGARTWYEVYPLGSDKAVKVYDDNSVWSGGAFVGAGIYQITTDAKGAIVASGMKAIGDGSTATAAGIQTPTNSDVTSSFSNAYTADSDLKYMMGYAKVASDGTTAKYVEEADETDGINDNGNGLTITLVDDKSAPNGYTVTDTALTGATGAFRVNNAKIVLVNLVAAYNGKTTPTLTGTETLSAGKPTDITKGSLVLFAYKTLPTGENETLYAYVYRVTYRDKAGTTTPTPPAVKPDGEYSASANLVVKIGGSVQVLPAVTEGKFGFADAKTAIANAVKLPLTDQMANAASSEVSISSSETSHTAAVEVYGSAAAVPGTVSLTGATMSTAIKAAPDPQLRVGTIILFYVNDGSHTSYFAYEITAPAAE